MSTWHQDRNRAPLWHETEWTTVIDPPNQLRVVYRFRTAKEANEFSAKQQHSYVLPPHRVVEA